MRKYNENLIYYSIVFFTAILFISCSETVPPLDDTEELDGSLNSDLPVILSSAADKAVATTGDIITWTVTLKVLPELNIDIPDSGSNIMGFRVTDFGKDEPDKVDGRTVKTKWYKLEADLVGSYIIPEIKIEYEYKGEKKTAEAGQIFIEVKSVLPKEGDATDIKPLKELAKTPYKLEIKWYYILMIAILALVLIVLILWSIFKKKKEIIPEKPAHEIALFDLNELKKYPLSNDNDKRLFFFKLSEIFRRYIEKRFNVLALEQTKEELIPEMRKVKGLENKYITHAESFLIGSDVIKFAKLIPDAETIENEYIRIRSFIQDTAFKEESEGDENLKPEDENNKNSIHESNNKFDNKDLENQNDKSKDSINTVSKNTSLMIIILSSVFFSGCSKAFDRFEDAWILFGLLLLPLVLYLYSFRKKTARVKFSDIRNILKVKKSKALYLRNLLPALRILAVALAIIAMARPQSGRKNTEVMTSGVDIILALDTSGSMKAMDFMIKDQRADRLTIVKRVVKDFIKGRKSDRIGMVVFGGQAYTQCPLTLDYGVLLSFLDRVEIGMAGDSTAVGSALGLAAKRLKDIESKSKVVILLTDGRNNAGRISPSTAADIAKAVGIKVYTIGAGTKGKAPFLVDGFFGKRYVYEQVDIDEDSLKEIAQVTGGNYFRATDTESLKDIYKTIDEMEKSDAKVKEYMEYEELFPYFLIAALICLLFEILLANTRLRKLP